MKTQVTKMRKRSMQMEQDLRKARARQVDVQKLQRAMWLDKHPIIAFFYAWFGVRPFQWAERYNKKYLLTWARANGWNASRLMTAVETLDQVVRIKLNMRQWRIDQVKKRARSIIAFNRKKERQNANV